MLIVIASVRLSGEKAASEVKGRPEMQQERARVRCDDCRAEFELFADLRQVVACLGGRPHRAIRLVSTAALTTTAPAR